MDRNLWKVENYLDFLSARRELLAKAANEFLESLYKGSIPESEPTPTIYELQLTDVPGGFANEEEELLVQEFNEWIVSQGLPSGEILYELIEEATGEPLAILDIAWPNGLQEGLSQPVALLIDEEKETEEAVNSMGYRYFRDPKDFKSYVLSEILASDDLAA